MESDFKRKFSKLYDSNKKRIRLKSKNSKYTTILYKGKPLQWADNGFITQYCEINKR